MHELSIAMNLVEIAEDALKEMPHPSVELVFLRLGVFSGVVKESLQMAYEIAIEDSCLKGSHLIIEDVPLAIYCHNCQCEVEPKSLQCLRCPVCSTASNDVRQGKEIEIAYLEISDATEIA